MINHESALGLAPVQNFQHDIDRSVDHFCEDGGGLGFPIRHTQFRIEYSHVVDYTFRRHFKCMSCGTFFGELQEQARARRGARRAFMGLLS